MKRLIGLTALLATLTSLSPPAIAQDNPNARFTLRPEGKLQLEWDSNALRTPGAASDTIFKTFAGFSANYKFTTGTSVSGQYQLQLWRFLTQSVNSTVLNVATLLVSQHIDNPWFNSIDPYIAAQLIGKIPTDITGGISRTDYNFVAGFNIVQSLTADSLFVGGYQFDRLQAEVFRTRYSSHALNFSFHQAFEQQFMFNAGYGIEYRLPVDSTTDDILRNVFSVGVDYFPIQQLKVGLGIQYFNDAFTTNRTARTIGGTDYWIIGLNVGSNLLFGW